MGRIGRRVAALALGLVLGVTVALPAGAVGTASVHGTDPGRVTHIVKATSAAPAQPRQSCVPLLARRGASPRTTMYVQVWCCPIIPGLRPHLGARSAPPFPGCCLINLPASLRAPPRGHGALAPRIPLPVFSCSSTSSVRLSDAGGGSATFGQTDALTATASTAGIVTFLEDGTVVAPCAAVSTVVTDVPGGTAETATCDWKPDAVGGHVLTAQLSPTVGDFSGATSHPLDVSVGAAPSTVTLSLAHVAALVGTELTATATVSAPGTVTFSLNGSLVAGCVGAAATATATCAIPVGAIGHDTVSVRLTPSSGDYADSSATARAVVFPSVQGLDIGPFDPGSSTLSAHGRLTVLALARLVAADHYHRVTLIGERLSGEPASLASARTAAVASALDRDLAALGVVRVALSEYVGTRSLDVVVAHAGL